jgi:hypothetical protein
LTRDEGFHTGVQESSPQPLFREFTGLDAVRSEAQLRISLGASPEIGWKPC